MTAGTSARALDRAIVLVVGSLEAGGAERQLVEMANFWASRGLRVTLATWSGREVLDFYRPSEGVRREHLGVGSANDGPVKKILNNGLRILKLRRLLKATRPDVVLSFLTLSNVLTLLASMRLPLRVVVSERVYPPMDTSVSASWRLLRRLTYRWGFAVVAQTRSAAQWIEQSCRCTVAVIPNALRPLPVVESERESLIIAIGRLTWQKGFDLLLDAFARIASRFPDWRIVIYGEGEDRAALESRRDRLGLANRVTFGGRTSDVERWMGVAGLIVQPSRFEGFPNVVLESMGMGAAVITTDCPSGPADLITDGIDGRLVPVEDPVALADGMAALMADGAVRAALGRRAVAVRERYSQAEIIGRWDELLFGNGRNAAVTEGVETWKSQAP